MIPVWMLFLKTKNRIDLKELSFEEFHSVTQYCSKVLKEEEIFEMILSWVNDHQESRSQKYFDQLVQYVNFQRIDARYLSDKVVTNQYVTNSAVCLRQIVSQKLKLPAVGERLLLLGGLDVETSAVKYFQDSWQKCADSLKPIRRSAVASNATHVFVVDGSQRKGHIQVYDVDRDTWSITKNILKTPRCGATATIVYNNLYIFAGCDGHTSLSSTEAFVISGASILPCGPYEGLPDLKVARWNHASVSRNGEVYFIGGASSGNILSSFESIDASYTARSTELPSLIQARMGLSAVLYDSDLIAVGGYNSEGVLKNPVESYSFDIKQWTLMEPLMVEPRWGHCSAVYRGQILVVGGRNGDDDSVYDIEVYDPETKLWKIHSALGRSRYYSSLLVL